MKAIISNDQAETLILDKVRECETITELTLQRQLRMDPLVFIKATKSLISKGLMRFERHGQRKYYFLTMKESVGAGALDMTDDLQKRNIERWRDWMKYDGEKYGYYLTHYDADKVRFATKGRRG